MTQALRHEAALKPIAPGRWLERALERAVRARLDAIVEGRLRIVSDGGPSDEIGAAADDGLSATVTVRDPAFWTAVALRGSVGAGESYGRGEWSADDLAAAVRVFVRNRASLWSLDRGLARLSAPLLRVYHALRDNTRAGSRRNIAAHYDASNDFFALFLDESMTYSSGIWERAGSTLAEAQQAKIDRALGKLALRPDDHLLEIGTGWGALAIRAARTSGCRVTTVTISKAQHDLATRRVREAGLEGRVRVLLRDWRDLEGTFSKLVSIEMVEAVGHRRLTPFLGRCARLLAPDGLAVLQAITIEDQAYDDARRSVDFIKRYVFPGSCIPSVTALAEAATRGGDLRMAHLEELGPHYARTLRAWRDRLLARRAEARALGFTEEQLRLWAFYFAYCEAGFAEGYLGLVQMVLRKPRATWPAVGGAHPDRPI